MFKIIFLSAFRSLMKYKNISLINLIGLVVGITAFLFSLHYILNEFSYDNFIPKSEQVYRVNYKIEKEGNAIYNGAKTPSALKRAIRNDIPEVEANALAFFEKCLVMHKGISMVNQDILWVSEDFEQVFPLTMIRGIQDYSRPRTGIIAKSKVKALFGNVDPIGKIMEVNGEMPIEITGIFDDLPSNTHLTADYFVSTKTWVEMGAISAEGSWNWNGWWNYVRLQEGTTQKNAEEKINSLVTNYMSFLEDNQRVGTFSLQALNKLHFISGIDGEMGATTNYKSVINLIVIALITLIIAWINYVNLAMAHTQARSDQINIRKLIGGTNIHLWHQSLAESTLINIAAIFVSFIFYLVFLKGFANAFDLPLTHGQIPLFFIAGILIITIIIGVLFTSIYQGIELSKFKTGSQHAVKKGGSFKRGLVITQMAVSILFLISTTIVYKQISYMKNKDLGMELNEVIICTGPASLNSDGNKRQRFEAFRRDILSYADFKHATFTAFIPGIEPRYGYQEFSNPSDGITPDVQFFNNGVGFEFIETYGLKLLAGKSFSINANDNWDKVILNESSSKHMGYQTPFEAIGKTIYFKNDTIPLTILGVVTDHHNEGLQKPIYPIVWSNHFPSEFGYFALRIHSQNAKNAITTLQTVWKNHYPKDDPDIVFANENFNKQYNSEVRFSKFYLTLTLLSIIISIMGLYGLIVFYLDKRRKEIGIRKVNGAKVIEVISMLNTDFIIWVGIAFLVACPLSYYIMNQWLSNFAYKTDISWWVFILSGLFIFAIVIITVSLQSWKSATQNPVKALRYE